MGISELVIGLLALAVGVAVGWFARAAKVAGEVAQVPVLREQLGLAHTELERERAEGRRRLEEVHQDRDRLADAFAALSTQALERNSANFIEQAEFRFAQREAAMKALVDPLQQALKAVQTEVDVAEKERIQQHASLQQQLQDITKSSALLQRETAQLATALRSSNVSGKWGEVQLQRIVEAAGMLRHVEFAEQFTTASGRSATQRPDMVIHLPGGKHLVLDAKAALEAYLSAVQASDPAERKQYLARHVKQLETHINDLASKEYWQAVAGSPEFVIMFIPADPILHAALEAAPNLLDTAFSKNVVVATPSSLMALLRTIAFTWRQERVSEDAQHMLELGQELYRRLGTMGRHLTDTGNALNRAVESYNRLNRSIDSQLLTQARRFADHQGVEVGSLSAGEEIEHHALPARKAELYTDTSESA